MGELQKVDYGDGKPKPLVDEKGDVLTRCWYTAGFNSRINTLIAPPHHLGYTPLFTRAKAEQEASERHQQMTAKHSRDIAAEAPSPHKGLKWEKSLSHEKAIPAASVNPWRLRRGGAHSSQFGGFNCGASWSKEPRTTLAPNAVPMALQLDHMKRFTHGNISRAQGQVLGLSTSDGVTEALHTYPCAKPLQKAMSTSLARSYPEADLPGRAGLSLSQPSSFPVQNSPILKAPALPSAWPNSMPTDFFRERNGRQLQGKST